jgi:MFS family permease
MAVATTQTSFLATRRGKLTLVLLCAVAFLDFVDASIVNIALPSIRSDLHFSEQGLQWVPSGYLLTYGGFMLLGGRAADLLGRRRILVAGTLLIGLSSLIGGFAESAGVLVGARLGQGLGAAMMLPAALSILTTTFKEGSDRNKALGVWGAVGGLASAAGVLLGGLLTDGPGWRWVMFVNPLASVLVLGGIFWLIGGGRPRARPQNFDVLGAVLATGGMLLLVYALVKAPDVGWATPRTIGGLAAALSLLGAFMINERRAKNPLAPLSIFRINGLAFSDATQLIAFAGFLAMFFFLTLYMQNVLGYSPIQTGAAYLPVTAGVAMAAGITSQLLARTGTRPVIVAGALIAAGGVYYLSRVPAPARTSPTCYRAWWSCRSASAPSSSASPRPRTPACRPRRPVWRRPCSTPRSNSAARWAWRSSPRSPPPAPATCWPPTRHRPTRSPRGSSGRSSPRACSSWPRR